MTGISSDIVSARTLPTFSDSRRPSSSAVLLDQVGHPQQGSAPLPRRRVGPGLVVGLPGGGDRSVDVGRGRLRDLGDHVAVGGADDLAGLAVRGVRPLAADVHLVGLRVAHPDLTFLRRDPEGSEGRARPKYAEKRPDAVAEPGVTGGRAERGPAGGCQTVRETCGGGLGGQWPRHRPSEEPSQESRRNRGHPAGAQGRHRDPGAEVARVVRAPRHGGPAGRVQHPPDRHRAGVRARSSRTSTATG